ncbi:MAG: circularly permuted type 2 ATP-grasp protein [Bacteriovoracaceae bacterium]
MKHVTSGKIKMNNVPGFEFIGDKEFYLYVDDLVKFYLKEEPLVKNIPTGSFRSFDKNENKVLNQNFFETVFGNKDKYVIKKVDGRGGNAVYIGNKMSSEEFLKLKDVIKKNPEFYIAQEFTPISTMDGMLVDMRVITDVSPQGVIVSDIPFGRAIPISGDGKVNISVSGRETTVLVEPSSSSCLKAILQRMQSLLLR